MSTDPTTIPRWQSHKCVTADRIVLADYDVGTYDVVLRLACGVIVRPKRQLETNGAPVIGGYYLLYDDGYESWSPAAAFENGYTRIGGDAT
jgi:hypothetical protein